jgi:gliding motility-associated lipoprotein GldD
MKGKIIWCFLLANVLVSCNSPYTLKPEGYFRIDFPEHRYRKFDQSGYPYTFEYPVYAQVAKDSTLFKDEDTPFWINVEFPQFNGTVYISYKRIGPSQLEKLIDDSYKMTYKHTAKATGIRDSLFRTPQGITGVWFEVSGDAATGRQFFLTDSTTHFLRGALYFDTAPNADSLGIVYDFLQDDMKHMIQTLRWK